MKRSEVVLVSLVLFLWTVFLTEFHCYGTIVAALVPAFGAYWLPDQRLRLLALSMFFPVLMIGAVLAVSSLASLTTRRIDSDLSAIDGGASVRLFHWCQVHPVVSIPLFFVYAALPIFLALSLTIGEWKPMLRTLFGSAIIAPFLYLLFPAVGPGLVTTPGAPPNCLPSLHVDFSFLCAIYWPKRWKWIGWAFVLLTAASTISTGEHYLIDVAAAIPYGMVFVTAEWAWSYNRRTTEVLWNPSPETN